MLYFSTLFFIAPPTSFLICSSSGYEVVICQTCILDSVYFFIPTRVTVISTVFSSSFTKSRNRPRTLSPSSSVEATVTEVPPTKSISKMSSLRDQTATMPISINTVERTAAGIRLPTKSTSVLGST